jgi:thiamine pyrophosphate-dependent acetolactate synthase large subunit-like protein
LNSVVKLFLKPALDTATRNIVSTPVNYRMQSLDLIMFTGARFPDSCNSTTNPVQQLIVNVLADLGSHQQHKIAACGYFNCETVP